jgi:hypothetical protein
LCIWFFHSALSIDLPPSKKKQNHLIRTGALLLPTADAMDAWEATKVVFDRVRVLDPDNAPKIMGLLLIQDNSDKELIRLAFSPEHLLHAFVASARAELAGKPASPPSPVLDPLQTGPPRGVPSPGSGDHQSPFAAADHVGYDGGDALYPENEYDCWSPVSGHRRSFSLGDAEVAAWRPCMYFARGNCRNGSSCRFLHGLPEDDAAATEREMAVMRAKALAAARPQQHMAPAFPFSPSPPKGVNLNFLLHHQQQHEPQRCHFYHQRLQFGFCLVPFPDFCFPLSGPRRRHAQVPGALASDGPRRPHRQPRCAADLPDIPGRLHLQRGGCVQLLQVPSTPPLLPSALFALSPSSPVMDEID